MKSPIMRDLSSIGHQVKVYVFNQEEGRQPVPDPALYRKMKSAYRRDDPRLGQLAGGIFLRRGGGTRLLGRTRPRVGHATAG